MSGLSALLALQQPDAAGNNNNMLSPYLRRSALPFFLLCRDSYVVALSSRTLRVGKYIFRKQTFSVDVFLI
jgi:hypothetical protein